MRIIIGPAGGPRQEWEFDRLMNVELIAIEKQTGFIGDEFTDALNKRSVTALTALVWVIRKRNEPQLRFEHVRFAIDELTIEEDEEAPDPKEEPQPDGGGSSEPSPNS